MDEQRTPNHTCITCGKRYWACDRCDENLHAHRWRSICCSPECYEAYALWQMFQAGQIKEQDALEKLSGLGIVKVGKLDIKNIHPALRPDITFESEASSDYPAEGTAKTRTTTKRPRNKKSG